MFKVDTRGIDELRKRFQDAARESPKEIKRLIVSTQRAAGTESRRAAVAIYNITQSRLAEDQVVIPTDKGVIVRGQKKPISSLSYKVKQHGKGLRLRVLKKGKTTTFEPGFLERGKGLPFYRTKGEAKRVMAKGRYAGKMRQPVHFLAGPSAADMMKDTRVSVPMKERIWGRVRKEFSSRIDRLTRKK